MNSLERLRELTEELSQRDEEQFEDLKQLKRIAVRCLERHSDTISEMLITGEIDAACLWRSIEDINGREYECSPASYAGAESAR